LPHIRHTLGMTVSVIVNWWSGNMCTGFVPQDTNHEMQDILRTKTVFLFIKKNPTKFPQIIKRNNSDSQQCPLISTKQAITVMVNNVH